ncbi:MAG: hypothetical protein ACRDGQ_11535 [Candidatus Limnocylindrales bacterium]
MAKRARGTTRPGQRRPIQRTIRPALSQPAVAPPPVGLSEAELAQAATLEAAIVATDRTAQAGAARRADIERNVTSEDASLARRRPAGTGRLAVVAAEEYRYVARDVRRIALIGGSMFIILGVLFVLVEAAGFAH